MKQSIAVSLRTLLAAAIVLALAFGARQARATSQSYSCERCVGPECEACCWAQDFDHGICPTPGVPCLCYDD